jgi:hypothetical protein
MITNETGGVHRRLRDLICAVGDGDEVNSPTARFLVDLSLMVLESFGL